MRKYSQLWASKQVSSKLREQIVSLERQCWSQYSEWECLELSDLPESIKDSELEDTALRLFKKRNVEIESSSIEDFRRLPSIGPKRVIKFSKRNEANSIRRVKQT